MVYTKTIIHLSFGESGGYLPPLRLIEAIKSFHSHGIGLSASRNRIFHKTGEYPKIFPNFKNCARCERDLKDYKLNSLHLGRKYARIFVLRHYLFLVAHSFPRASLSENCSLFRTDNVRGKISENIFAPNGDYCLFIIHQIFLLTRDWSKRVT